MFTSPYIEMERRGHEIFKNVVVSRKRDNRYITSRMFRMSKILKYELFQPHSSESELTFFTPAFCVMTNLLLDTEEFR